jgi:hypothetical protein
MNKAFRKYLTDGEIELIEATKPTALAELDEDELVELHTRVRRARSKYSKLHRRQASAQVRSDRGRGKAAAKNPRSAAKAEVFEDALARVSRSLAAAAKASAAELKAERLAMAASVRASGPATGPASKPNATAKGTRARGKGAIASTKTPARKKQVASTGATNARRQAKRDSR